jgi:hypothetical protein
MIYTAANKRLLISESRGDSNRCTPCRGNLTNTSHAFHAQSAYGLACGQRIATFREVDNNDGQSHCFWEKELLTQSTARRLADLQVRTQFLSQDSHWSSGGKATLCWRQATRLTGLISPACDWYFQYLLVGANPSVLNRHRRGLQPPKSHARSQVIQSQHSLKENDDMKYLSSIRGLSTTWRLPKSISMPSNDYRLTNTSKVIKGNLEGNHNVTTVPIDFYQPNAQSFLT